MTLAYHILAHKNPRQVERLFEAIYHPEDLFVLHFDRRSGHLFQSWGGDLASRRANVLLQTPRTVIWGGPAISDLQVEAMALALEHGSSWSHFINLTGQDLPLKSRQSILETLAPQPDRSYLSWFDPIATGLWSNARERLFRWHPHHAGFNKVLTLPGLGRHLRSALGYGSAMPVIPHVPFCRRKWPDFFQYFGGSNYVVLSREACRYMSADPLARRIRLWLAHSAHADEILFQSTLLSSPLASTLVNRDWREVDFPLNNPHPRIFRSADFDRLAASPNLFARKFDENVDVEIIERLLASVANENPSSPAPSSLP